MDITADGTEGKRVAAYAAIISSCRQWSFAVSLFYLCVLDASKPRDKACFTTRTPMENLWSITFIEQ